MKIYRTKGSVDNKNGDISLKYFKHFFLVVSLCFLTACASFQGGDLKPVRDLPKTDDKPSAQVLFDYKAIINDRPQSSEKRKNRYHQQFITSLRKTDIFGEVGKYVDEPDLTIDLSLINDGSFSQFGAFLSGATLTVIPGRATDRFMLNATITNQEGKKWSIHLEERMNTWIHITLLPVAPFKWPGTVAKNIQENIARNLSQKMIEKNIISATKKDPS